MSEVGWPCTSRSVLKMASCMSDWCAPEMSITSTVSTTVDILYTLSVGHTGTGYIEEMHIKAHINVLLILHIRGVHIQFLMHLWCVQIGQLAQHQPYDDCGRHQRHSNIHMSTYSFLIEMDSTCTTTQCTHAHILQRFRVRIERGQTTK